MNNARQETVADIVREMRIGDLCAADTTASRPEYINDFLTSYADRIEAAWKREQEAGAETAQICGKIGEIVGRATTEKSSVVGNAEEKRECLGGVSPLKESNIKAMREALEQIDKVVFDKRRHTKEEVEAHRLATTALTTPPRNCDRFKNIKEAKIRYCIEVEKVLIWDGYNSEKLIKWLFAEAKGETK